MNVSELSVASLRNARVMGVGCELFWVADAADCAVLGGGSAAVDDDVRAIAVKSATAIRRADLSLAGQSIVGITRGRGRPGSLSDFPQYGERYSNAAAESDLVKCRQTAASIGLWRRCRMC